MSESNGRVEAIWIKRFRKGPMDRVSEAEAIAGKGLAGNANQGGKRQVILLSAEEWAEATEELGVDVDPSARRGNLLVSGIDLDGARGRILSVGGARLRIHLECKPCRRMEEAQAGLQDALRDGWRGGACAEVLDGGEIAVGDSVRWVGV